MLELRERPDHAAIFDLPYPCSIAADSVHRRHQGHLPQKYAQSLAKLPPVMRPSGQPTLQLALTTSQ